MVSEREFLEFAAEVLGVPVGKLSVETTYGSIPEWDSMAHLRLVMEVAAKFGVEIPFAEVTGVTSLWEFWRRITGGSVRKVVAVDLDNTLWEGVVGEDGCAGIRPNEKLLRELKALKERGVLLVVLSKNNLEDGLKGVETLGVLTKDDFVAWRIDWNGKAENLVAVAAELNLGVDSFVFVDDNPAERLEMAAKLPEVAVAAFPPTLEAYFPSREVTAEDRRKTEEYKAEARRKPILQQGLSPDQLCRELGVELDVHVMRADEVARVAQLSQKANQFNVCTNRYSEEVVRELGAKGLVVTAHARDRFGDQGLVAFVVVRGAEIVDWVMSCRAMGRGIESRIEAEVERLLAARGVTVLGAMWRSSGRNAPVRELFDRFGFSVVGETEREKTYSKVMTTSIRQEET